MPGPGACTHISIKTNKTTYSMRLESLLFLNILIIRHLSSALAARDLESIPALTLVQANITLLLLSCQNTENILYQIYRTLRLELLVILCGALLRINARVI